MEKELNTLVRYCEETNRPLRPPPRPYTFDNPELVKCGCGKFRPIETMAIRDSGVLKYVDNVCPDCAGQDKGMARIICAGCRTVVARMAPHKDKNGFKVEAGKCYHVDQCPGCNPKLEKSMIIEKVIYARKLGGK